MNEIVKSNQAMNLPDIMNMAKTFAESGLFSDAKGMAQAFVKIQAGQEIGIPPFAAMSGIHLIQGKLTIGAGLIASTVKGSGKYDYKVIQLDDKICSLDFFQNGQNIGNSTFTLDDAKKAGTKNLDKFPKNMLFARAISNGVKWYCPDVFAGPVYVPEEMPETIDIQHEEIKKEPEKRPTLNAVTFDKFIDKLKENSIETLNNLIKYNYELTAEQKHEITEIVKDKAMGGLLDDAQIAEIDILITKI